MDENILNKTDLKLILKNFHHPNNSTNIKYVSSEFIPVFGNVEGFMGDYYTLQIKYKLNDDDIKDVMFFVKHTPTQMEFKEKIAKERNLFGKEIFYLDFLLKEYEKYNLEFDFAPRCFYSKNNEILVLENLDANNYELSGKNTHYDLEQCKVALKALSAYHGSSLMYEELKSQELGEIFRLDRQYPEMFEENYFDLTFEKQFARLVVEKTIRAIKYVIKELNYNFEYKHEFENYLTVENLLQCIITKTELRKATGHGDLWYNNIFFKYNKEKVTKCVIIDHQVMRYFYPVFDVLTFIYLNTNREFREVHLPYLLKYYYDSLSEVLQNRGFEIKDVLPLEEFNASLKLVENTALFTVIAMGTLVFMSQKSLEELHKGMEMIVEDAFEYHYELLCRDVLEDECYKKKLSNAVHDLYNSFVKNIDKYEI